jgi:hypothetical protein
LELFFIIIIFFHSLHLYVFVIYSSWPSHISYIYLYGLFFKSINRQ